MKKFLPLVAIVLIIGIASVYLSQGRAPMQTAEPATITETQQPVITPEPFIAQALDASVLLAGGSSYADPQGVYSVLYPNDYILDTESDPQHVRIYKRGPTERPQSEVSDGVIMVFERLDLAGKTLEETVDDQLTTMQQDSTTQIISPKKAVTLNGYQGFTYSVRSLGESTTLVVSKDQSSPNAVMITYSVDDPQNQGYTQQVMQILSTLKLLQ